MRGERDLRKRLAALERRMNTLIMVGTAESNQGSKTKVRFDDAGAGGQPFSSPLLPQASCSGKNGQGVSRFSKIGIGEPVLVFSPGGELGIHSRVLPGGPVDDQPSPGTAESDGDVLQIGNAAIAVKDGEAKISVGGASITLTDGLIVLKAAQIRLEQG
ncbi:hypothetical protein [Bosea minatitlanensis]|uniref:Phage baseplate assembly protein V n=1 Tax=Bosea minatitlanensis TaxID=128782 RepID=A0ABW0F1J5_9HYPH|nr:hypothetical protein [Bosea minatitlanensis]MCT4491806.1 hypothetical protein [Bosea minatitlanensis]